MIEYLLDEHVPQVLAAALRQREPALNVWRIGDPGAPRFGTPDPEILLWCEQQCFVLVTNNRQTMPDHLANHLAAGGHVPGILTLSPTMGLKDTVDELILIANASDEHEFRDQIRYLPISE